ncbi:MAG: histidine phosphatase family protein [Chitinophagales bacterium]
MTTGTDIYIIRHGQTDHNAKGIVQGKGVNLPLNELGRNQAQLFYKAYQHIPFDVVYTSTLLRAQETVASFIQQGIPHLIRPALDEISWGNLEGNNHVMENSDTFLNLLASWKAGNIEARPSGGESPLDVQQRQQPFIEELKATSHKNILICMHGRAMRVLMCTLSGRPLTDMEYFQHVNLTLYQLRKTVAGTFDIILHNHQTHLQ